MTPVVEIDYPPRTPPTPQNRVEPAVEQESALRDPNTDDLERVCDRERGGGGTRDRFGDSCFVMYRTLTLLCFVAVSLALSLSRSPPLHLFLALLHPGMLRDPGQVFSPIWQLAACIKNDILGY